jgi:hypothetical protein
MKHVRAQDTVRDKTSSPKHRRQNIASQNIAGQNIAKIYKKI